MRIPALGLYEDRESIGLLTTGGQFPYSPVCFEFAFGKLAEEPTVSTVEVSNFVQ